MAEWDQNILLLVGFLAASVRIASPLKSLGCSAHNRACKRSLASTMVICPLIRLFPRANGIHRVRIFKTVAQHAPPQRQ